MATVVAAMAATHAPGLTGWFDRAPESDQKFVLDGYGELAAGSRRHGRTSSSCSRTITS